MTLGHTYEKRGALAKAWAAYDQALTFPPHKTDETLTADRERVRGGLTAKQGDEAGRTPVIVRYRDEVTEEFTPRSVAVALDFAPVLTKDKEAGELHTPEFHRLYSGSVAAGNHVLVVDVVHDCAPSARKYDRSHLHRAWPFTSEARTPTTLELRAYTEPEDGDSRGTPSTRDDEQIADVDSARRLPRVAPSPLPPGSAPRPPRSRLHPGRPGRPALMPLARCTSCPSSSDTTTG